MGRREYYALYNTDSDGSITHVVQHFLQASAHVNNIVPYTNCSTKRVLFHRYGATIQESFARRLPNCRAIQEVIDVLIWYGCMRLQKKLNVSIELNICICIEYSKEKAYFYPFITWPRLTHWFQNNPETGCSKPTALSRTSIWENICGTMLSLTKCMTLEVGQRVISM